MFECDSYALCGGDGLRVRGSGGLEESALEASASITCTARRRLRPHDSCVHLRVTN